MPATWEPIASETVTEVVTPTLTREVEQIVARAAPSGIVFYVRLPDILQDPVNTAEIVGIWAGWMNELGATPGVLSVSWVQDIDATDQVVDTLRTEVASSSGRLSATLTLRTEDNVSTWQTQIAAARATLDQIEAS